MDLKFTFGSPAPATTSSAMPSASGSSSVLELHATIRIDDATGSPAISCEGVSGDGVVYASARTTVAEPDSPSTRAAALRSALARAAAALPEPLIESISAVVLKCGEPVSAVLHEWGLSVTENGAAVDASLQARTGISDGTPIRIEPLAPAPAS